MKCSHYTDEKSESRNCMIFVRNYLDYLKGHYKSPFPKESNFVISSEIYVHMVHFVVMLNSPHSDICYFLDINFSFNQTQAETCKVPSLMEYISIETLVLMSNLKIFLSLGAFLGWRTDSTKLTLETSLSEYPCPKVD